MKEYTTLTSEVLTACEQVKEQNNTRSLETGKAPRAYVLTFGCQQNEADSELLCGLCQKMGYEITDDPKEADLILANTCAIREHAEKKALSIIGGFKACKRQNPDLIIGVTGCMAAEAHRREEIKQKYPYVDLVFSPASRHRLPQLILEKRMSGKRVFCPEERDLTMPEGLPVRRKNSYRAWVSIMYGCNNFCSYCIVPYVRGRERSRKASEIVSEVEALVGEGYKDITLLGQNVNSYGKDLETPIDFADLLARLDAIPGDFRLRFMTSHPKDAGKKLIDVMAASSHVARQFHLPLQSGSDKVLKEMNRHYDREKYLATVAYLREKIPDVTLSTDIIVGFPGESDEDFEDTLSILNEVKFDQIFSFLYSPRKGTPAAGREDQVPKDVKAERFDRLLALQNEIGLANNQKLVGKELRILCDGPSKSNPNLLSGRTDGGKIVFFHGDAKKMTGQYVLVTPKRADAYSLYETEQKDG
ncbi:MAG: tRNA (N6-isopentenyl adenosine(37)-C2)-methylthiotransferase MiaB [Clostridia bacterium]|nr:tRNA (N6-isopentenyl adenosine(37)-C2)-methylthiotransferase MiaB [Clostridia bacterium]